MGLGLGKPASCWRIGPVIGTTGLHPNQRGTDGVTSTGASTGTGSDRGRGEGIGTGRDVGSGTCMGAADAEVRDRLRITSRIWVGIRVEIRNYSRIRVRVRT